MDVAGMNEIKMNFIGLSVREKRRKVHFIGSISADLLSHFIGNNMHEV